jgi:hypothetical protein
MIHYTGKGIIFLSVLTAHLMFQNNLDERFSTWGT